MSQQPKNLDHVNYDSLDTAKNAFIEAGKKTLRFAEKYGFLPDESLGASANVFSLNLQPFLDTGSKELFITLLPEGLGTADDARPDDLNAEELQQFWHNIGIKTVAVMTNDAASTGMQTILISLYLPCADPEIVFNQSFIDGFLPGFIEGCKTVGCVYFSGETPQLKNKIYPDKLDIAGALFGLMPPGVKPVNGDNLAPGDTIVFVECFGPMANGYTGLRKLAEQLPQGYRTKLPSGKEYWQAINDPSPLYTALLQDIFAAGIMPTNVEHITGHGWQKIMRSNKPLRYVIEKMLPVPEIFPFIEQQSQTTPEEMIKIYNYGVGLALYIKDSNKAKEVIEIAKKNNLNAIVAGHVEASESREVVVQPLSTTLSSESFLLKK